MYGELRSKIDYSFYIYQNENNINKNEMEYLQLLSKINDLNKFKKSRNSNELS